MLTQTTLRQDNRERESERREVEGEQGLELLNPISSGGMVSTEPSNQNGHPNVAGLTGFDH